jgi:TPR repeat protein
MRKGEYKMKHYNFAFGVAFSGIVLTGCVFNEQKMEDIQPKTVAAAKTEAEIKLDKDLALAKFMFENKNDVKAFEVFLKYAEQGNTEAEAWLGRCYMNGIGTSVNYEKAFEYFSKAATKNHPYGINGLGVCKQYGYGTGIDLRAAIDYYKKAADMNFPLATLNLARSYSDKQGGFYDEKLAEEFFKKAVAIGAKGAKDFYASFLIDRKRYDEAIPLLQQSKKQRG